MGHIKDIANQPKTQSFPSSTFAIAGDVPPSQCFESRINIINGDTTAGQPEFTKVGAFVGFDLATKILTITVPPINAGDYTIISNTDDVLICDPVFPATRVANTANVHDPLITYLSSPTGQTIAAQATLTDPGKWSAGQHDGRAVTITAPAPNIGTYGILSSTNDTLNLDAPVPATNPNNVYTIHNVTQDDLTRNASSFRRFIESQGRSHTTKAGTVYTNTPTGEMQNACSITFDPLS